MQKKNQEQILREKRKFWKAHIEAWQNIVSITILSTTG